MKILIKLCVIIPIAAIFIFGVIPYIETLDRTILLHIIVGLSSSLITYITCTIVDDFFENM